MRITWQRVRPYLTPPDAFYLTLAALLGGVFGFALAL
jgi:hypothetical protein